jgi:hypothetical protein
MRFLLFGFLKKKNKFWLFMYLVFTLSCTVPPIANISLKFVNFYSWKLSHFSLGFSTQKLWKISLLLFSIGPIFILLSWSPFHNSYFRAICNVMRWSIDLVSTFTFKLRILCVLLTLYFIYVVKHLKLHSKDLHSCIFELLYPKSVHHDARFWLYLKYNLVKYYSQKN